jgi:hypothetical protein
MPDEEKQPKKRAAGQRARQAQATAAARRLYDKLYQPDELAELRTAANGGTADLSREIELLRVLVRRAVESGAALDVVSQAIARLATIVRANHQVSGDAARSLDDALARVLREIGVEIGL